MALFADTIKADPLLTAHLNKVATGPQNSIRNLYDKLRQGFQKDSTARHVGPSDYFDSRAATSENFANQGLQGSLESILGDTTYKDTLNGRDADANEALAREIGALNKPSTLEEVLYGLGGGAKAGGSLYAMLGKSSPRAGSTGPSLSLYDPYSSGYGRYS